MKIQNKEELDEWLFQHSCINENCCIGIKGELKDENGYKVNIAYKDTTTNEVFHIIYE